ncbi:MAG TPA: MarR family transcriptional regulator [Longimicrobium sp.]|jgi:DNA-binding transcriptional regulator GbsR (MarR family)
MEGSVQQFVERMGLLCEREGMPRGAGRMFGLLLIGDRAYSLDELAEKLQASKASVSTNARMLESLGLIERVSSLGDRRDFYRAGDDPWERMLRVAQGRWMDMIQLFDEARESLPADRAVGCERLCGAARFHRLLVDRVEGLIQEWKETRRASRRTAGDAA